MISPVYGTTFPEPAIFTNRHTDPFSEDSLAFSIILYYAGRRLTGARWFSITGIMGTILLDATVYFLVIFSAHVVLTMTIVLARVSLTGFFVDCVHADRFH